MAKKASVSVDDVVKGALLTLATADGPRRLSGKGDHPAIFATAGAEKQAAAAVVESVPPLVSVTGAGKAATVTLTAAGFERIADALPGEQVGAAAAAVAKTLPLAERVAFLQVVVGKAPLATADLLPVLEAAVAEEQSERVARETRDAQRRAAEAASLAALERWKAILTTQKTARIEALRRELAAEGAPTEVEALPRQPEARHASGPESSADRSFRRDVANQLVSAWRATWEPDEPRPREFLESAIWNVQGMRLIGEPGQRVTFDGLHHEGGSGLFQGDAVRIVRPGWLLEEDDAEYVVLKARVEK